MWTNSFVLDCSWMNAFVFILNSVFPKFSLEKIRVITIFFFFLTFDLEE